MIENFLDFLRYELNRAPATVRAYEFDIREFSMWLGNEDYHSTDFTSVTQADIRAWLASLGRQGGKSRTLRRKAQSLRALFKWMLKNGFIPYSPMRDIPLPKIDKPLPSIIRDEEIEEALTKSFDDDNDRLKDFRNALILEILYSLGIRKAELIGLNDSSISFHNGEIKVLGKRSKQRVIPIPEVLMQKIRKWQIMRDRSDSNNSLADPPLFSSNGKRISGKTVYNIVNKSLEASSAKKKSPHALRHSFASGMLNGGANLDSVREFLGHSSLSTTQIYTHISFKDIKKAYNNAHPRAPQSEKD